MFKVRENVSRMQTNGRNVSTDLYGAVEEAVVLADRVEQSLGAVERHAGARVPADVCVRALLALAHFDHHAAYAVRRHPVTGVRRRSPGYGVCLLYTSPSPRDRTRSRMPSSA